MNTTTESTPAVRVEVAPDAVLLVTVDGDDVTGRSDGPFGNWCGLAAAVYSPTYGEVETATIKALGFAVYIVTNHLDGNGASFVKFARDDELSSPVAPDLSGGMKRIKEASAKVRGRKLCWEADKEKASESKELYEAAVDELQKIIDAENAPLPPLLAGLESPPSDDWRSVPLTEALQGVSAAVLTKLADAGLTTVGEMADYTGRGERLANIKGVGPAKLEAIESAMEAFWSRRGGKPESNGEAADDDDGNTD